MYKGKSTGRPNIFVEGVARIRECYVQSPKNSNTHATRELEIPQATVRKILRKQLLLNPFHRKLVGKLHPNYLNKQFKNCRVLQNATEDDFIDHLMFNDKVKFHWNGKVNGMSGYEVLTNLMV